MLAPLHPPASPPPFARPYSEFQADSMRAHFDRATIDRPDAMAIFRARAAEGLDAHRQVVETPSVALFFLTRDAADAEGAPDRTTRCSFCGADGVRIDARGACGECA